MRREIALIFNIHINAKHLKMCFGSFSDHKSYKVLHWLQIENSQYNERKADRARIVIVDFFI